MTREPGSRRGLAATAGGVAGLTLVSRVLGLGRWAVQALTVGSGTVAGAYSTANQVPNVLYEVVVGGALAATVVPLLAGAVSAGRREEARSTANGLLGAVLVLLVPPAVLLALLADSVASAFPVSHGVDASLQVSLVADFLRMFALQVPLYGVGVVLTGVLQAHGSFTWPALSPVLSSVTVMGTYALYAAVGGWDPEGGSGAALPLQILGWGTTAGVAALSLPLLWPAHRLGLRLRPTLRLGGATARRALRLGAAGLWTLLAQQVSVVVVLGLARSGGTTGTVAVYQYTQAVYTLPYAILVVPVATVLYPRLSAAFETREPETREEVSEGSAAGTAAGTAAGSAAGTAAGSAAGTAAGTAVRSGTTRGASHQPPPRPATGPVELVSRSTALVTAVALAGAGMLLSASEGAERFFSLLAGVEGMGAALVVLAPGLVGYAWIYQVTRVLYAADRAAGAARATAAGWLTVALVSALAVRLLVPPQGGDAPATLVALALGQSVGMATAAAGLAAVLARRLGAQVLARSLTVLLVGAPVGAVLGYALRALTVAQGSAATAVALAVAGAAACALAVLAAVRLADRSVLAGPSVGASRGAGHHKGAVSGTDEVVLDGAGAGLPQEQQEEEQ